MTPGEMWHAMPLWVWPLFEGWPDGLLEWMVAVGMVVLAGLVVCGTPLAVVLAWAAGAARAGAGACGRRMRVRFQWNGRRRARPARRVRGRGR